MLLSNLLKYAKYKNLYESFENKDNIIRKYTNWYKNNNLRLYYKVPEYLYRYKATYEEDKDPLLNYWTDYYFGRYGVLAEDYGNKEEFELKVFHSYKAREDALRYSIKVRDQKTFIELLYRGFPELTHASFDKFDDADIIEIPVEKARSKKYENFIEFWENEEGDLVAISSENKIKLLFYSYGLCYFPNKDYKDQDIEALVLKYENPRDAAKEFVSEAYIKRVLYNIAAGKDEIKKIIKTDNTNILQKAGDYMTAKYDCKSAEGYSLLEKKITKVYGFDYVEFLKKYKDEEKTQSREDYRKYLINLESILRNKFTNYNKKAQQIRYSREYDNTINAMNNAIKVIRQSFSITRRILIRTLLDDNIKEIVVKPKYSSDMFDTIGEAFKRLNEYYIQLIDDLTRIQDYIKHTDEAINSDEKHSYVFMSLNALLNYIKTYNNNVKKLTEQNSFYNRIINTLKPILTPEELSDILKIEDTGIYTIIKKEKKED